MEFSKVQVPHRCASVSSWKKSANTSKNNSPTTTKSKSTATWTITPSSVTDQSLERSLTAKKLAELRMLEGVASVESDHAPGVCGAKRMLSVSSQDCPA